MWYDKDFQLSDGRDLAHVPAWKLILFIFVFFGGCILIISYEGGPQKELTAEQKSLASQKLEDGDLVLMGSGEKQEVYCFKRNSRSGQEYFASGPAGFTGRPCGVNWAYAQRIIRPTDREYCELARKFLRQ